MELSLRRLALFSSGVGFFEYGGTAEGPQTAELVFDACAVNDALKSLAIGGAASEFPVVRYASASALRQTLGSLKIDLSGEPGLWGILNSLKGAEIEAASPAKISGRVIGVEKRPAGAAREGGTWEELFLLLFTGAEVKSIAVRDISSFAFKDEKVTVDLNRALDTLSAARDEKNRRLVVSLPGEGKRDVSLSYVIPVPVWKVSYRLNLGAKRPFIQGWAIVDNDSDTDWNDAELSLVSGRPVSFIQNLSEPYLTSRPELPLAIAGFAGARTYESGEAEEDTEDTIMDINQSFRTEDSTDEDEFSGPPFACFSRRRTGAPQELDIQINLQDLDDYESGGPPGAGLAAEKRAGDQFEFTLKGGVTIERRQSAMLPLIEAEIKAERLLVLSGKEAQCGTVNPSICVKLVNETGMNLPAGPITVYDAGTYAGDALIEFLPENEERIISYGEDLSVRGSMVYSGLTSFRAAAFSKGVLTVSRTKIHRFVYTVRNASASARKLIIEHPVTPSANLTAPAQYEEKTPDRYRFSVELPANKEIHFTVTEEEPLSEDFTVGWLSLDSLVHASADTRIPAGVRASLARAAALRQNIAEAQDAVSHLTKKKEETVSEQERIRRNLEAAGNQTAQGRQYLSRLAALDEEIDALAASINEAEGKAGALKKEFEDFIRAEGY
ncbi:MAG: DUF4139 domain-containing protein [Treponema sp.]|jgi:hypothetical protein|nr:DUF4139 domain-containing protein [Treponema sp.]